MKNKISSLIEELGITAYKFAKVTDILLGTVYELQKDETRIPSGKIMDRIFLAFPDVEIVDLIEKG